uniref:TetR/AcrR family transcriptional regulator n=1 Tax=Mycolicibacterium palauense TaxID=2034511 RepID=UPI000BFEEDFA|nr:TetR family transcriptional regulator [Mycolicibacterium palauense]
MAPPAQTVRKRGRRQGGPVPRDAVLAAAKRRFADQGYEKTTLRQIADDAGVDPSMVSYLFGSKNELFRESLKLIIDPESLVAAMAGPPDQIGLRLSRVYLQIWEGPDTGPTMAAMLASATSNNDAHEAFRDFMQGYVLTAVSEALGSGPDTRLRAMLAATNLVGTALLRYVMKIGPLADVSADELLAMLAPCVQRYLTADVEELGLPAGYRA